MPPRTLARAGVCTLAAGIFLYWGVPIWLRAIEPYTWDLPLAEVVAWLCLSLAGAGALLLINAAFGRFAASQRAGRNLSVFPGLPVRNVLRLPRHRPIPLIAQLPNFGLICGAVLWILVFLFLIVRGQHPYYGLLIDFTERDSLTWTKSPWQETLSVYLGADGKYYVNNKPVKRAALREALLNELNHRMVWTVYFEADSDALNMDAIYAMDAIQGLGARLIWITPKTRLELQQRGLGQVARPNPY